ncbi:MAG: FTR1 family iron permease [Candidatus Aenigmatarchaeota archaeon]|nr:MAG: FTR1 family iron permease [Candidatus Aenigmarchaeota archaeon]
MAEVASFIITFRETLEAALIVGIILAYLSRTGETRYNNFIYLGVAAGIIGSVLAAIIFNYVAGGFEGVAEEIFEGTVMLIGAVLITFMILWMMNQKHLSRKIELKVKDEIQDGRKFGLFLLVFFSVLREGVETVLFLGAASFAGDSSYSLAGSLGGVAAAIALGYVIFSGMKTIDLKKVFMITGTLLVLFAAGLVAHGVHELQEAGVLPIYIEHLWDVNPPQNPDGTYPSLHDNGSVGSLAKGLFGYNGNPSLLEVVSYLAYIVLLVAVYIRYYKNE